MGFVYLIYFWRMRETVIRCENGFIGLECFVRRSEVKQSIPDEALIIGNSVPMSLHVKVFKAYPSPDSDNCKINEEWYK